MEDHASLLTEARVVDLDPVEIARQLTMRESTLFSAITAEELWYKGAGHSERAPNVVALIDHLNQVALVHSFYHQW